MKPNMRIMTMSMIHHAMCKRLAGLNGLSHWMMHVLPATKQPQRRKHNPMETTVVESDYSYRVVYFGDVPPRLLDVAASYTPIRFNCIHYRLTAKIFDRFGLLLASVDSAGNITLA
jgi:hypothetical protein